MQLSVCNVTGETVGQIEASDAVFDAPPNPGLLHQALVYHQANQRQGTSNTLTRALVSGGGRKPFAQKGTGRARVGSTRNPIWRSGGVALGPQPRDYSYRLPRKVARGALRAALQVKLAEGRVIVVSAFELAEPRTRLANELLAALDVPGKALLIETTNSGWGEGKTAAPQGDWKQQRLGPAPTPAMVALADAAFARVLAASGCSPALFDNSDGTSKREALRQWHLGVVVPLARQLESQLTEKLDTDVRLRFDLYNVDLAGRAQAFQKLVAGGVAVNEALTTTGLLIHAD